MKAPTFPEGYCGAYILLGRDITNAYTSKVCKIGEKYKNCRTNESLLAAIKLAKGAVLHNTVNQQATRLSKCKAFPVDVASTKDC